MAYITIKTNTDDGLITLQERVMPGDMESEFFCAHLVERLRWAVADAHAATSDPTASLTRAMGWSGSTPGLVADTTRRRRDARQRARLEF